jgi:hypothetical protein
MRKNLAVWQKSIQRDLEMGLNDVICISLMIIWLHDTADLSWSHLVLLLLSFPLMWFPRIWVVWKVVILAWPRVKFRSSRPALCFLLILIPLPFWHWGIILQSIQMSNDVWSRIVSICCFILSICRWGVRISDSVTATQGRCEVPNLQSLDQIRDRFFAYRLDVELELVGCGSLMRAVWQFESQEDSCCCMGQRSSQFENWT